MKLFLIPTLICLLAISCKDKEKPTAAEPISQAETAASEQEIKLPAPVINKPDSKFVTAATAQKPDPALTDQIWHYVFALSIKDPTPKENIYEGHWLDLLPDGTFKQGIYQETLDNGYFILTNSGGDQLLELRSDKAASEWKVKSDPAQMLLVGTAKYGNNPWQIKLKRETALPTQKN